MIVDFFVLYFLYMRYKVALVFICLNQPYWPYAKDVIEDCRKNFLTNHEVDYFLWSDIPRLGSPEHKTLIENSYPQEVINHDISVLSSQPTPENLARINELARLQSKETVEQTITFLDSQKYINIIPTEPATWPLPTLMRYHLFLQEEEKLKEYDYIFYMDADMRVVAPVTEEILGEGLTAAEHPMYSFDRKFRAPIEPNPESTAYINAPRYYYAGGFQGGKSADFIEAMKVMRKNIDKDFFNNYQAIWNDESHWNKYLSEYQGHRIVLSPSYIYPDSLIKEYYEPIWGRSYKPIVITLTKPFSVTKEGGAAVKETIERFKKL